MKIYDIFPFFNEIELLELRLNMLNDFVDHFVIVESKYTHSGIEKEFIFEKNKHLFENFINKIIYIKSDEFFSEQNTFERDVYQKNYAKHYLNNIFHDEDIIIFSDIDEIPNPKLLNSIFSIVNDDKHVICEQLCSYYYFNVITKDLHSFAQEKENWFGTRICTYEFLKPFELGDLRHQKFTEFANIIKNGGWHFTYIGGVEKINEKLIASAHQEFNNDYIKNNLEENIKNNKDIFYRNVKFETVQLDERFPDYILNNLEKYQKFIRPII